MASGCPSFSNFQDLSFFYFLFLFLFFFRNLAVAKLVPAATKSSLLWPCLVCSIALYSFLLCYVVLLCSAHVWSALVCLFLLFFKYFSTLFWPHLLCSCHFGSVLAIYSRYSKSGFRCSESPLTFSLLYMLVVTPVVASSLYFFVHCLCSLQRKWITLQRIATSSYLYYFDWNI